MSTLSWNWCEGFAWLDGRMTVENTQTVFKTGTGTYCKICDRHLDFTGAPAREKHVKQHVKEFVAWKAVKAKEVRQENTERLREVSKLKAEGVAVEIKDVPATAREQGVPEVYLKENGAFKPGLDARLKSDLCYAALGIKNDAALAPFTEQEARRLLVARDWTGYLVRKEASLAKQAAAAKKKAA